MRGSRATRFSLSLIAGAGGQLKKQHTFLHLFLPRCSTGHERIKTLSLVSGATWPRHMHKGTINYVGFHKLEINSLAPSLSINREHLYISEGAKCAVWMYVKFCKSLPLYAMHIGEMGYLYRMRIVIVVEGTIYTICMLNCTGPWVNLAKLMRASCALRTVAERAYTPQERGGIMPLMTIIGNEIVC